MCLASAFGSSGSQMIAVCLARLGRCRSTQLAATFSAPSSNHLMCRFFASHETFFTLVKGFTQSSRLASSPQNPSGSFTERAYISSYLAWSMKVRFFASAETGMSVSDMSVSQACYAAILAALGKRFKPTNRSLYPVASAVANVKNFHAVLHYAVDEDVIRSSDDKLPRFGASAGSA